MNYEFSFKYFVEYAQRPIIINGIDTGYMATRSGKIYKVGPNNEKIEISRSIGSHGYEAVTLHYNQQSYQFLVHRLVAKCFCPGRSRDRRYVNHIDGIKTHNGCSNLEWVSNAENMQHALNTGLHKGSKSVYTDEQIHEVCKLLEAGELTHQEISRRVGVECTLIRDIKFKGSHKAISSQYNIKSEHAGKKELRSTIFNLMEEGYSNADIVNMLNIDTARHVEYCRLLFNRLNKNKKNGRYKRVDHKK